MVITRFAMKDFETPPTDNELIRNWFPVRQHFTSMTTSQILWNFPVQMNALFQTNSISSSINVFHSSFSKRVQQTYMHVAMQKHTDILLNELDLKQLNVNTIIYEGL